MEHESFRHALEAVARDLEYTQERMRARWAKHANRRSTLLVTTLAILIGGTYYQLLRPPEQFPYGALVSVSEGTTLTETALSLEEQGVVRSALALRVVVTMLGGERSVHAGDYLFKVPMNTLSIARALVVGAYGLEPIKIRVPEGTSVSRMARIFDAQLERFDKERFIQKGQPLEGYLFPDTYFFLPNATEDTVIKILRSSFDIKILELANEIAASGHTQEEIVIMASILEREASNTTDRRMISDVLWSRLEKGMRLQVDATFVYTLGKGSFDITRTELRDSDDPYNTYVHYGLPPGAIGNPSLDSLRAAATPIRNPYFFYLADHSGVTHYAKTYTEHLRNKAKYLGS